MDETWKPIPGYEGLYDASSNGRIRSSPGKVTSNAKYGKRVWKSRIMRTKHPLKAKRHDERVSLWKNGTPKDYLVARLVASAFLGVPGTGMTVNHKNGDYFDNRPENLEWVTRAENTKHAFATGLCDSFMCQVSLKSEIGAEWHFRSFNEANRFLHRNHGYLSRRHKNGSNEAVGTDGTKYTFEVVGNG